MTQKNININSLSVTPCSAKVILTAWCATLPHLSRTEVFSVQSQANLEFTMNRMLSITLIPPIPTAPGSAYLGPDGLPKVPQVLPDLAVGILPDLDL